MNSSENTHLIVDDNELNRIIIKILLEKNNFIVDELDNGADVIEIVEKDSLKYKIIWLDVNMPGMDGVQCAKTLRTKLKYKGTIIGITGCVDYDLIKECTNVGMDYVIPKPITEKQLIECVNRYS